jgi:hypothetical protein
VGDDGEDDDEYGGGRPNPTGWIDTLKVVADYTNSDFNTAWEYSVSEFFAYLGAHINNEREKSKRLENARITKGKA